MILSGGRQIASEACCNRDQTQAVFPDPVIRAIMEVKEMLEAKPLTVFLKALELFVMG